MTLDLSIEWILRGAFLALFAASLVHKVFDFPTFRMTVAAYVRRSPLDHPAVILLASLGVLGGEALVVGVCLLPVPAGWRALAIAGQLLLYAAAMAINLARGNNQLDCGCNWGSLKQTVGAPLVYRNVLLALLASVLSLPASTRAWQGLDVLTVAAGIVMAGLRYAAANRLFTQPLVSLGTK